MSIHCDFNISFYADRQPAVAPSKPSMKNKWLVLVDISVFSKCLLKMTAWFIISSEAI